MSRKSHKEKAWLLSRLHPDGTEWGVNVSDYDPLAVTRTLKKMSVLFGAGRYFRVEVEGWENIPPSPVMIVSNHSGGTLFLDSWGLLFAWYANFGTGRPLHPAVHEVLLGNSLTAEFLARRGAVQAHRHLAQRVLSEWRRDLLVMPGGDLDVWRPYRDRYRVQFAGRTGYARIALEAGLPVVPVANAGAHETLYVLSDGRRFAEMFGLPKFVRAHIWPVHLSLPWGLAIGPLPHMPPPTKLRYRFGAAVEPPILDGEPPTDEQVAAFDARVRAAVQGELDQLAAQRRP